MFQDVWYEAPDWATTNPVAVLMAGLAGGLILSLLLFRLNRRSKRRGPEPLPARGAFAVDALNMAHLRVVGAGSLGILAMCAVVAIYIRPVGISLGTGFLLGTVAAVVMIIRRSRTGPISSSSQRPGANTMLMIDEADDRVDRR